MNNLKPFFSRNIAIWQITIPFLLVANLGYLTHNVFGWAATLIFFFTVPGYLILQKLKPGGIGRGESLSLSIGLSLSLMIIGGLLLNSFNSFGLDRPLTTLHIFVFFDFIVLLLTLMNAGTRKNIALHKIKIPWEQALAFSVLSTLPFLAAGGAIRLNNGASNILTLILMALIGASFILLPIRKNLKPLYPYAIFVIGMSILFCNSLRGWDITGHDIHHEFSVFQNTSNLGFWLHSSTKGGDPYNACLSITILPTILAKITSISAIFIYKVVFQILFASLLPTLLYMFRRFTTERKAILGVFVFMTFPTFTNDLPFLNRQEIAFAFVILLMFVNFMKISYKTKIYLTMIFIVSIILSHYSSSYVTLILLLISPIFYKLISRKRKTETEERFPLLNTRTVLVALLLTFAWNSQITASTGNLKNTIVSTVINLVGPPSERQQFSYNLTQAPTSQKPLKIFGKYAAVSPTEIKIVPKQQIPITKFGHLIGHVTGLHNAETINVIFHAFLAKILQLLVVIGTAVMLFRTRKTSSAHQRYLLALACASLFALMLFTLLPQLSVDYDVTRLFQQSLLFLWLPSLLLAESLFFFLGKFRLVGAAGLFAFLYLNLAGFIPQITGGFPPQLPLNNSGLYYDYFYTHDSDIIGTGWLGKNREPSKDIQFDSGAALPRLPFGYGLGLVNTGNVGYLYLDYTDTNRNSFRTIIDGVFIQYTNPAVLSDRNKVYANDHAQIYLK